jgi:peptide deformylase
MMRWLCLVLLLSCTKELKYTKEQLLAKAQKADSSATVILPKTMADGVQCHDYTEGCLSAHIVQVKKLDFIAVEFMTEEQAKVAARKIRGYQVRNWVFDDVTGEPTLEKFVQSALEAKKP